MKNPKLLIRILAGILALIMVLGLILSIIPTSVLAAKSSSEIREEIDALEDEQMNIWIKMDELEAQQDDNWEDIEGMVAQKDNIDQQIGLLHTEILNINAQITGYSLLIAEKQNELDEAQTKLDQLSEENKLRIRAMEEEGPISYWSVLFKANSFTDLLDRLNMIQEIAAADERRLEEMNQAAEEVEAARLELEAEKTRLEGSREELKAAQAELEVKRAEADEILTELNAIKRELAAKYEEMEAEEHNFSALIAGLEQEYTEAKEKEEEERRKQEQATSGGTSTNAPASDGGWYQPCSYTVLTSAYGWRVHPITGNNSFHNGVDLANVTGTPIYAAKSGTVTAAGYNGVYGYYVTINHGDGFSTLYGHMTNYVVSEGQSVSGGQLIGYMGSTGWSTGPHLHFTIYYNGNTVNPMDYI